MLSPFKLKKDVVNVAREEELACGPDQGVPHNSKDWCEFLSRCFGDSCSEESAKKLSAVFACVDRIATPIAKFPLGLYRKERGKQGSLKQKDHPLARLLRHRPTDAMTWTQLRTAIGYQVILTGNSYVKVFRDENFYPKELFPLDPQTVSVEMTRKRLIRYKVMESDYDDLNTGDRLYDRSEVAHFKGLSCDGLKGVSVLEHCRKDFANHKALCDLGRENSETGNGLRGIINLPAGIKKEHRDEIRKTWGDSINKARSGDGFAILSGDTKFTPITMSMQDAQFIEQKRMSLADIARIFNVPLHKIQDLDRATNNNIEVMNTEFYKSTLLPWITSFEEVYNQTLLTERERDEGYHFKHNVSSLLRASMNDRMESYQKGIHVMTINEMRAKEDLPSIDGCDTPLIPMNHLPKGEKANEE